MGETSVGTGQRGVSERFCAHILPWVREHGAPDAATVTRVDAHGTDWDGSTEEGFDTRFTVDVGGLRENGQPFWLYVDGELLESLWKWAVQGFGEC